MPDWMIALSEWFTHERYLYWSRLQGLAWTGAGVAIIICLLGITNTCRRIIGRRRHCISYVVLAATFPFIALLPIAPTGMAFFRLELVITIPHFLLIIYLLLANLQTAPQTLARLLEANERTSEQK